MEQKTKEGIFFLAVIFAISILLFHNIMFTDALLKDNSHDIGLLVFNSQNRLDSLMNGRGMPMWSSQFYGGNPLLAIPEEPMVDLVLVLSIIFQNVFYAINWATIIYFFLAGAGMFFLAQYLCGSRRAGLVSALLYMLNGFVFDFVLTGHKNILESYALIPFALLFGYKALKENLHGRYISYAILAGLMLGLQILGGGIIFFLYTCVILFGMIVFGLLRADFAKRIKKALIVSVIIVAVAVSISAVKLLPTLDFVGMSSRAGAVSMQEFVGTETWLRTADFSPLSLGFMKIGLVGMALALLGVAFYYRNRNVLYFGLMAALGILLIETGILQSLFYNLVPGFSKMRNIHRALVLFVFAASVLAAFGYNKAEEWVLKKLKSAHGKNHAINHVVLAIVVLLAGGQLMAYGLESVFHGFPKTHSFLADVEDIEAGHFMAEQMGISEQEYGSIILDSPPKELFRFINIASPYPVTASGYQHLFWDGLQDTKGGGGIWINDYISYIVIAQTYDLPKMLGMLNVRYVMSEKEIDTSADKGQGLLLVQKFNECEECYFADNDGPFLYEIEGYMPRFYFADESAVVLGDRQNNDRLSYSLILSPLFDANDAVLISLGSQKEIEDAAELGLTSKSKAMFLADGSLVSGNEGLLQAFSGKIVPDIRQGALQVTQEDINEALSALAANETGESPAVLQPVVIEYNPKRIRLDVSGMQMEENGGARILVMAEKFFMFPGDWKAYADGNEIPIFQANVIGSAVVVPPSAKGIVLEYKLRMYKIGMIISIVSALVIAGSFIFYWKKK